MLFEIHVHVVKHARNSMHTVSVNKTHPKHVHQGSHRLENYLNLEGFLEMSLKIKSALKSTGKPLKCLEKSLNSFIFCRT